MGVKAYKDLIAWQKAISLVTEVYRATKSLPKDELFGLASQLRRAAVSIPSNFAEGQGRPSRGEFRQFLGNARGSLFEVQTQIHVAGNLDYFDSRQKTLLLEMTDELGKILNGLLRALDR